MSFYDSDAVASTADIEAYLVGILTDGQVLGRSGSSLASVAPGGGATATDLVSMRQSGIFVGPSVAFGGLDGTTIAVTGSPSYDEQLGGSRTATIANGSTAACYAIVADSGARYSSGNGMSWHPGLTVETGLEMVSGDVTGLAGPNTAAFAGASGGERSVSTEAYAVNSFGVGWVPDIFGADAAYMCFYTHSATGSPTTHRVNIGGSDIQPNTAFRWRVRCICNAVDANARPTSVTIQLIDPADETSILDEHTFTSAAGDNMPAAADGTVYKTSVHGFGWCRTVNGVTTGTGSGVFRVFDTMAYANIDGSE